MRKIFKSTMLVAAAAMAFASCQKEENIAPETISATLTMHADVEATKTYLGEDNTVLWGKGESVQLYVGAGETSSFVASTSTNDYDGKASASFTFNIGGVKPAETYSLGGIYPASAAVNTNNTNPAKYKVQLPATQQSADGNYDPAAYIMVLKPEEVNVLPEDYTASFRRATALNNITLTNVAEDITSVEITVPEGKYLAGRRNFDLTTGESGEVYVSGTETNVVKINGDFKAGDVDVWFCSWGVELEQNEVLTVKLTSATKSYTRSITVNDKGIKFVEGGLNTLKINMGHADTVVETLDNLAGEYIVAAMPSAWVLMSGTNSSNVYTSVTAGVTADINTVQCDDFYNLKDIDLCIWTVAKMDGGYSLQNNATGKFLNLTANDNKAHTSDIAVALDITVDNKEAKVVHKSYTNRNLQYNSGSPRFAFYTGTQKQIYFIPWVADTTPKILVDGETTKNIPYEGGEVTFNYTLKNLDGKTLNVAVSNSEMLSASASDGVVTVTVAANDSDERTATITLSCGDAEDVVLTVSQGAWEDPNTGGGDTQEYTYTWTASSGALGTTTNGTTTMTLNNVDWTIQRSDNSGYTGWTSNVIHIGSKSNPENLTLTTSAISGTIKSVSVACASYQAKHNINISVGGVSYVSNSTPIWSNNSVGTVVGEGNSTGDIEIKFTKGSGARALYVKSITIVYEN